MQLSTHSILVVLLLLLWPVPLAQAQEAKRQELKYAPAPIDNPLKGLVPYRGESKGRFPHSMEFSYLPLSELVTGEDRYNWQPLEDLLNQVAGRGNQLIFRIYLEYPGKTDGIPPFLVQEGMQVHQYLDQSSKPPVKNLTPDYENPALRKVLRQFIAELGKKYDGDPRIGFITAGLLGHWGEWHTYPQTKLFASKAAQAEVLDAYAAAFSSTHVLLRYPAGAENSSLAPNADRAFGYHDDSFAWATLDTGRKEDSWFYLAAAKEAGTAALNKWKTAPIGGEIRPEAWGKVFDETPGRKEIQNFRQCVEQTHASWLMDSGMFGKQSTTARQQRAAEEVRRMGYELHVRAAQFVQRVTKPRPESPPQTLEVLIELENRGVAPFYSPWPAELGLISKGKLLQSFPAKGTPTGILPGDDNCHWSESISLKGISAGTYQVALRIPNPLPTGKPLRFANESQDADLTSWLTLGEVTLE